MIDKIAFTLNNNDSNSTKTTVIIKYKTDTFIKSFFSQWRMEKTAPKTVASGAKVETKIAVELSIIKLSVKRLGSQFNTA